MYTVIQVPQPRLKGEGTYIHQVATQDSSRCSYCIASAGYLTERFVANSKIKQTTGYQIVSQL